MAFHLLRAAREKGVEIKKEWGVDHGGKRKCGYLGGLEGGETVVRIYYMRDFF